MTAVAECVTWYLVFLGEELHVGDPDGGGAISAVGEEDGRLFNLDVFLGWAIGVLGRGEGDEKFQLSGGGLDVGSCYSWREGEERWCGGAKEGYLWHFLRQGVRVD